LLVRSLGDVPEELGRHDVLHARPGELLQRLAHDLLALAVRVDLGVVEEIDAAIEGRRHAVARRGGVDLVAVRHPRAEGKLAHLQAGAAESSIVHFDALPGKGGSIPRRYNPSFRATPAT